MRSFVKSIVGVSLWGLALSWLSGCVIPEPPSRPPNDPVERIGTLRVIGGEVFRNDHRARNGEEVYAGDTVTTGAGSSAIIELPDGGEYQLDENTDPEFSFKMVPQGRGRRCIHIRIKFGRVWVNRDLTCFDTPNASGIVYSTVDLQVAGDSTTITLFQGTVLITAPMEEKLGNGEQVTVTGDRIGNVRRLSAAELDEVARWREKFPLIEVKPGEPVGWCCLNGRLTSSEQSACLQSGGQFFLDPQQAKKVCSIPKEEGYCCTGKGDVQPMSREDCDRYRGTLYKAREYAEQDPNCNREPVGWCCLNGRLTSGEQSACFQSGGQFFLDPQQAKKVCSTPKEEGYCCTGKGDVQPMSREDCDRYRGTLYKTREDAKNDKRCHFE